MSAATLTEQELLDQKRRQEEEERYFREREQTLEALLKEGAAKVLAAIRRKAGL